MMLEHAKLEKKDVKTRHGKQFLVKLVVAHFMT